MKSWIIVIGLVLLLALGACSPTGGTAETTAADSNEVTLTNGDLSVAAQLALGTVQLEETEQAVSETQAAELLPLWQAYQTLSQSDTTAAVELEALAGQIQRAMTAEQVQAIAGMDLTADTLTEMQASGELGFGGFARGDEASGATGATNGDFQTLEGGMAGGGPPGDFAAGGGPGGGGGGGGAMPGGAMPGGGFAGGEMSEDDMATRQAAMADMDPAAMQDRMLISMVVRLLQTKTGETPTDGPGGGMGGPNFDAALTAAAEATGLSADDIRAQMAEGQTLTAIIEANGGDVAAVRAALVESLSAQPNAGDMDVEQMVDRMLGE